MKIELKAIQHSAFASQETNCYTANLYVDGRKIGAVGNDGHGGPDHFRGDHEAFAAADAWCKANLPRWQMGDRSIETDLELRCGELVDDWLAARELKKTLRSHVLFTDAGDGKLYQARHRGEVERTIAAVEKKHPGSAILNAKPFEEALALYRAGTAP